MADNDFHEPDPGTGNHAETDSASGNHEGTRSGPRHGGNDFHANGSAGNGSWSDPDETGPNDLVRALNFDTAHPVELDITNGIGPIRIELAETALTHVEVRHDPESGALDGRGGLGGLLTWVHEQLGEAGIKTAGPNEHGRINRPPLAEAVRRTRIDMTGSRLVVQTPSDVPLRGIALAVTVRAPVESQVGIRTGSGAVTVDGPAGRTQIQSGSGPVTVDQADGGATIRAGSGQLRLGTMTGGVQARSGSGDVEVSAIEAPSSVVTGSGNVWLGAVRGDVLVRSGSGDLHVADASSGQTELITGSGELRVGLRRGASAEVDLTSSTGTATSDLPLTEEPPEDGAPVRVFGRTGSGDVLITSAL